MEEYFVAIRIDLPARRDPRSESYDDAAVEFYEAVSEVLGAGVFGSPMALSEDHVGTYVYLDADSPTEAAQTAVRLFSEASEHTWGPGTRVRVECNGELAAEGIE